MDAISRLSEIRDKIAHLDALMWSSSNGEISYFQDYIENHQLPICLAAEDTTVIYCNEAMSRFLGKPLYEIIGKEQVKNWYADQSEWNEIARFSLEKGKVSGIKANIKTHNGDQPVLIYSSIHRDDEGKWINSRCLYVPLNDILD